MNNRICKILLVSLAITMMAWKLTPVLAGGLYPSYTGPISDASLVMSGITWNGCTNEITVKGAVTVATAPGWKVKDLGKPYFQNIRWFVTASECPPGELNSSSGGPDADDGGNWAFTAGQVFAEDTVYIYLAITVTNGCEDEVLALKYTYMAPPPCE